LDLKWPKMQKKTFGGHLEPRYVWVCDAVFS